MAKKKQEMTGGEIATVMNQHRHDRLMPSISRISIGKTVLYDRDKVNRRKVR